MDVNFAKTVADLEKSIVNDDVDATDLVRILETERAELTTSFVSTYFQSLHALEQWAWQVLGQHSDQCLVGSKYFELLHGLTSFNTNLVCHYEQVEVTIKSALLIPERTDYIDAIFAQIDKCTDDNDPFITLISVWLDNLSFFVRDNPEYELSDFVRHLNRHIEGHCIMTDQYKVYLDQLCLSPLSPSIFTAKLLFYVKTCSFAFSSYLFATSEHLLHTPEEIFHYVAENFVPIVLLHSSTLPSWSQELLACITHLILFISSCCWCEPSERDRLDILFPTERVACLYIDALIRIVDYKPFYQCIVVKRFNDATLAIDASLFAMRSIAQNQDFVWFLRSKLSLSTILMTIAETVVCDKIRLCIYTILGEFLTDEHLKELKIPISASIFLFNTLEQAWHHPLKKYKQAPISLLLRSECLVVGS